MHAIFYRLKRVFHLSEDWTKSVLRPVGLTPSRFTLLYIVQPSGTRQRALRSKLGVASSTVSRALKSLEERGFVTRVRDSSDRRHRIVHLTDAGRAAMGQVVEWMDREWIDALIESRFCSSSEAGAGLARTLMTDLDQALCMMARALGNRSQCPYDWDYAA